MNKRFLWMILLAAAVMLLTGCQQAQTSAAPTAERYIGANVIYLEKGQARDESRSESHEVDGDYLLIPFAYSQDGEKYTQALRSGPFGDTSFRLSTFDEGNTYAMSASLYLDSERTANLAAICIERVYQREDDTCYAIDTGHDIPYPLTETVFYDWSESRAVTDEDGRKSTETTKLSLTLVDAPMPTDGPASATEA